jgi:peptidoglycan/xylan/chitin deacetylase (PgdA/CDA1 family)
MTYLIRPLRAILRGKGLSSTFKRIWTLKQRYDLTAAKMDGSLAQLSRILHQFDCQATLPITAVALARNSAIIQKYQAQGIEFAVHGHRHVDYSELTLEEQRAHFSQAARVFRDHGIRFDGFRCPYLRWNEHTLKALGESCFVYDSSGSLVWNVAEEHATESYYRALSFYGAEPATDYPALPHLDTAHNLVRIPYCLPDDESLVERLTWRSPAEMDQVWPAILDQTHERGELFTLGLHPERIGDCANALVAILKQARAATPAVWCARLDEIAAWWKTRRAASVDVGGIEGGLLQLAVNGPEGTTLLLRSLDVRTATAPGFDGYQRATETPCMVHTNGRRPFVGVSPGTAPAMTSFLKQQGYIVEASSVPDLYPIYLDHDSFSRADQGPLLARIEGADFPLARLGRWPEGARSALAVTGDVDSLTLWDYGLRFFRR